MRGFSRNHRHRDIGSLFPLPPPLDGGGENCLLKPYTVESKFTPNRSVDFANALGFRVNLGERAKEQTSSFHRLNSTRAILRASCRHFAPLRRSPTVRQRQSGGPPVHIAPPSFGLPAHTTQHGPADQAIWRTRHRDDSRRHHLGRLPDLVSPVPIQRPRERSTLLSTPTGLKIPESPIRHEADRTTTSDKQYPSRKLERRRRRFGPSHRSRPGGYEDRARRAHWNLVVSLSCGTAPTGLDSGP